MTLRDPQGPLSEPNADAPHVVMVVSNDVSSDTRVRKSALAVAALGLRVTVVGVSSTGSRMSSRLGPVTMIRVPVDFVLRDARRDRRRRWHRGQFQLLELDPSTEALRRRRVALAAREAADADGVSAPLATSLARGRRFAMRAEGYGRRRAATAAKLAFKVYDRGVQSSALGASPHRVVPEIDDFELAIGPVLDELAPDLVHAHDVQLIEVVARHVSRARASGRQVRWLYDAHEWVTGLSRYGARTARVVAAWSALEGRWIDAADRVITVSPPLAAALQERYHLTALPDVVLNVPPTSDRPEGREPDSAATAEAGIRAACGLSDHPEVTLCVYSGGVQAARGVQDAVAALVELPQVHLAVVAVPVTAPAVENLRTQADRAGVADRVHILPPVPPDQVSRFLRTADVGLIPLRHFGSHEMALANKLFEYLHAELPMVVSDCQAQADFVRDNGLGEVHRAEDPADLAAAIRRVLENREQIRERMRDPELRARYTWQRQARVLQQAYREMLPAGAVPEDDEVPDALAAEPPEVAGDSGSVVLAIGPANSAGQGWGWTRAAVRYLSGVSGYTMALRNETYDYPADEVVARATYRTDADWQLRTLARARGGWTHVLLEAGRPMLGAFAGRDFVADADLLRRSGIEVGLVFHGSEVRDPRRHRATHEFSPFSDPRDDYVRTLQARVDTLLPAVDAFDGPLFCSTPDQLTYLPERTQWLPVVVDNVAFSVARSTPLLRRDRPLVVHAPSNPRLKGTADVERVLGPLHEQGVIELRMITGMPPEQAGELVREADIVVDQLLLGLYGVLACEAMASGRIVVGHLGEDLRSRVGAPVPVIETNPRTLSDVISRILDDRDSARAAAAAGPDFVRRFHDGRRSAAVLAPFLGLELPPLLAAALAEEARAR